LSDTYVGIDLGGTNIKAGIVDSSWRLLRKVSVPTEADQGEDVVIENICAAAEKAAEETGWDGIRAIGIGSPGPLDHIEGVVHTAPNLPGWKDVKLADKVRSRLGIETFVENDANAACWGEYVSGAGKGCRTMVLITLGTGIGSGFVLNGHLWRNGAEMGHMVIDCDGELCLCGSKGCLEAYASAPATVRRFEAMVRGGAESVLEDDVFHDRKLTAQAIYSAAADGDPSARAALEETGRYLGVGVANLANLFNPDKVVFSGGLAGALDILLPVIREEVFDRAFEVLTANLVIEACSLPDDVGVIGAAGCAAERAKGK
jgi:glucokinase